MGKKITLEKFLKFFFRLQISKKKGGSEVASALVLKSVYPSPSQKYHFIPRIALLFSRSAILFPRIALSFCRSAYSSKMLHFLRIVF